MRRQEQSIGKGIHAWGGTDPQQRQGSAHSSASHSTSASAGPSHAHGLLQGQVFDFSSVKRPRSKKSRTSNAAADSRISKRKTPSQKSAGTGPSPSSLAAYDPPVREIINRAKLRYIFRTIQHGAAFPEKQDKDEIADECYLQECKVDSLRGKSSSFTLFCHSMPHRFRKKSSC
jgi:hypothetical protein